MDGVRAYGSDEANAGLDEVGEGARSTSKSASEEFSGILAVSSKDESGVSVSRTSGSFPAFS